VAAVFRDGLRRVLGLRRKARRKVLPWGFFAIAIAPAIFFVAFNVLTGDLLGEADTDFFGPAQYFNFNASLTLLFIAVAASELLIPDRQYGTLQVYASRPLHVTDYLAARAASLSVVSFAFLFLPQVLLVIGTAAVSDDGILSAFTDDLDLLWQSAFTALVFFVAYAAPAFAVASLAGRTAFGAGIFIAGMFLSTGVAAAFSESGLDFLGVLALEQHPRYVRDWVFGSDTGEWVPEQAGLEPWMSLVMVGAVALVAVFVVVRRYRRVL
jgi:ABC-type transport system involved in multi-copper enzyme maturation permease subunit